MNDEQLKKEWLQSQKRQENFTGWNFSSIQEEFWQEGLPWCYSECVKHYLRPEFDLLDMGTGGGELLASFNHPLLKCHRRLVKELPVTTGKIRTKRYQSKIC